MGKHRFPIIIEQDEDGIYIASVPSLAGCHTQAKTLDELMERIKEAIQLYIETENISEEEIRSMNFIGLQEIEVTI
jgi:predicted RNase H-like HicB family nuclease